MEHNTDEQQQQTSNTLWYEHYDDQFMATSEETVQDLYEQAQTCHIEPLMSVKFCPMKRGEFNLVSTSVLVKLDSNIVEGGSSGTSTSSRMDSSLSSHQQLIVFPQTRSVLCKECRPFFNHLLRLKHPNYNHALQKEHDVFLDFAGPSQIQEILSIANEYYSTHHGPAGNTQDASNSDDRAASSFDDEIGGINGTVELDMSAFLPVENNDGASVHSGHSSAVNTNVSTTVPLTTAELVGRAMMCIFPWYLVQLWRHLLFHQCLPESVAADTTAMNKMEIQDAFHLEKELRPLISSEKKRSRLTKAEYDAVSGLQHFLRDAYIRTQDNIAPTTTTTAAVSGHVKQKLSDAPIGATTSPSVSVLQQSALDKRTLDLLRSSANTKKRSRSQMESFNASYRSSGAVSMAADSATGVDELGAPTGVSSSSTTSTLSSSAIDVYDDSSAAKSSKKSRGGLLSSPTASVAKLGKPSSLAAVTPVHPNQSSGLSSPVALLLSCTTLPANKHNHQHGGEDGGRIISSSKSEYRNPWSCRFKIIGVQF